MLSFVYIGEQHSWDIVHFVQKVWNLAHSIYLPWSVFWDVEPLHIWPLVSSTILFYHQNSDRYLYLTYATLNLFKLGAKLKTKKNKLTLHNMYHYKVLWYFTGSWQSHLNSTTHTNTVCLLFDYLFFQELIESGGLVLNELLIFHNTMSTAGYSICTNKNEEISRKGIM